MKTVIKLSLILLIAVINLNARDYRPTVLIRANWGSADAEFGLRLEAEGNCPQALAVADDGTLAILDPVNNRVQLFSPKGRWQGKFPIASGIFDIGFQRNQVILLAPYDYFVARYSRDGELIEKTNINRQIVLIDGLRVGEDDVGVQTIDQVQYSVNKNSPPEQIASAKPGASSRIAGQSVQTQWIAPRQGQVIIKNKRSAKTQSILIATDAELGSLVFLDSDLNGNIFVRKELFSADGTTYFEVDKFDLNGALRATIRIEHENIVMPFKPITIDQHGNIYFLEINSDGFSVIQWQEK